VAAEVEQAVPQVGITTATTLLQEAVAPVVKAQEARMAVRQVSAASSVIQGI
jgi:hypothetical protein